MNILFLCQDPVQDPTLHLVTIAPQCPLVCAGLQSSFVPCDLDSLVSNAQEFVECPLVWVSLFSLCLDKGYGFSGRIWKAPSFSPRHTGVQDIFAVKLPVSRFQTLLFGSKWLSPVHPRGGRGDVKPSHVFCFRVTSTYDS